MRVRGPCVISDREWRAFRYRRWGLLGSSEAIVSLFPLGVALNGFGGGRAPSARRATCANRRTDITVVVVPFVPSRRCGDRSAKMASPLHLGPDRRRLLSQQIPWSVPLLLTDTWSDYLRGGHGGWLFPPSATRALYKDNDNECSAAQFRSPHVLSSRSRRTGNKTTVEHRAANWATSTGVVVRFAVKRSVGAALYIRIDGKPENRRRP